MWQINLKKVLVLEAINGETIIQLNHFKLCNTNNKIPKELTYRYLEFVKIIKKIQKKDIDTISWMWVVVLD